MEKEDEYFPPNLILCVQDINSPSSSSSSSLLLPIVVVVEFADRSWHWRHSRQGVDLIPRGGLTGLTVFRSSTVDSSCLSEDRVSLVGAPGAGNAAFGAT